jgi:hypothetical protein
MQGYIGRVRLKQFHEVLPSYSLAFAYAILDTNAHILMEDL